MLFARNAQEAADLAVIARRAAEESETPFFVIQDGFLTTHTIESLRLPEPELMKVFVGDPNAEHRLRDLMNPSQPIMSGVVQNQDSYMKGKIAQRFFYERLPGILRQVMERYGRLTDRRYGLVDPHRLADADYAIVGMGSLVETATATADYLREREGLKVGTLHLSAFRPFPGPDLVEALKGVKALAVIERMDNPPAQSNPLTAEIKAAFADALSGAPGYPRIDHIPMICSGSAGLGSRDIRPGDFLAVVKQMRNKKPRRFFVIGINHELALKPEEQPDIRPPRSFSMRGHSVGGYGSVTTNKIIATIVSDLFGLQVQAYPKYGSEKKGLPTTYYLTVADRHIRSHSELEYVDFIPLNSVNAFYLGNPLEGLSPGGALFLQHSSADPSEVWRSIPKNARDLIRAKNIRVFVLDAVKIASEVATRPELAQRMQGIVLLGVFLRVFPYVKQHGLRDEEIHGVVESSMRKFFGKRGEQVIRDNLCAVMRGNEEVFQIPNGVIDEAA